MTKLILIATLAAGAAVFAPQAAVGQACTQGYMKCLNDTADTSGFLRVMADVECFAAYLGCVRRTI